MNRENPGAMPPVEQFPGIKEQPEEPEQQEFAEHNAVAERISASLLRKKKLLRYRRIIFRVLGVVLLVGVLTAMVLLIVKYWDFFKPENFEKVVSVNQGDSALLKIGGALDSAGSGGTDKYSAYADGVAVVTTKELRYATESGENGYSISLQFSMPAVASSGDIIFAYDAGGTTLISANKSGELARTEAEGRIIGAYAGEGGRLITVSECTGYICAVTVYDSSLNKLYVWRSSERWCGAAALSPDGSFAAVAVIEYGGGDIASSIALLDLTKEGIAAEVATGSELALKLLASGENFIAVTDAEIRLLDRGGTELGYYLPDSGITGALPDGDGGLFLATNPCTVSAKYRIIHLDGGVRLTGTAVFKTDVKSVSASHGSIAVLTNSGIKIYNSSMELKKAVSTESGTETIILLANGKIVMLTPQEVLIA